MKVLGGWLTKPWETLLLWNSKERSAVSTRRLMLQHLYEYQGDVIANSTPYTQLPTDAPTRARILFWFTNEAFCKRHILSHRDSYVKFLWGDLQAKVVPKRTTYCVTWGVTRRVPQASLQADSTLTRCHEQKPQEPWRTRWPQEKGHWAISPDSRASHPLCF